MAPPAVPNIIPRFRDSAKIADQAEVRFGCPAHHQRIVWRRNDAHGTSEQDDKQNQKKIGYAGDTKPSTINACHERTG